MNSCPEISTHCGQPVYNIESSQQTINRANKKFILADNSYTLYHPFTMPAVIESIQHEPSLGMWSSVELSTGAGLDWMQYAYAKNDRWVMASICSTKEYVYKHVTGKSLITPMKI